jgi:peptidyl-prolyl cis-trans isomerase C
MHRFIFVCLSFFAFMPAAHSEENVFARKGDVILTQEELDAAFARIPREQRLPYIRDGEKVEQLVAALLRTKQVAKAAMDNAYDENPLTRDRMAMAAEKELAEAWMEHVVENAPEADYKAMAYENYLAHPESFQMPERVNVSHILIQSNNRSDEEALELATSLKERLTVDPELFDEFVNEYSEDPAKVNNNGTYPGMQRGQMVAPFEETAFAMTEPGQISDPVKTDYGYHLIRLNEKMPASTIPYEQIEQRAIAEMMKAHLDQYRKTYILDLTSQPISIPEGAVEAMLKRHFGENLELSPDYYNN